MLNSLKGSIGNFSSGYFPIVQFNLYRFLPVQYRIIIGIQKKKKGEIKLPEAPNMRKIIAKFLLLRSEGFSVYKKKNILCFVTPQGKQVLKAIAESNEDEFDPKKVRVIFNLRSIFSAQEREKTCTVNDNKDVSNDMRQMISFEKEVNAEYERRFVTK
jgi:hypothetical protein